MIDMYPRSWVPNENVRILVYSKSYPVGHEMRWRIIDSMFLPFCDEVTKWRYLDDPE